SGRSEIPLPPPNLATVGVQARGKDRACQHGGRGCVAVVPGRERRWGNVCLVAEVDRGDRRCRLLFGPGRSCVAFLAWWVRLRLFSWARLSRRFARVRVQGSGWVVAARSRLRVLLQFLDGPQQPLQQLLRTLSG